MRLSHLYNDENAYANKTEISPWAHFQYNDTQGKTIPIVKRRLVWPSYLHDGNS